MAEMLAGVPIEGARVLDVGSGLGAVDVLLVRNDGAASVTGVDVESHLIAHSEARAAQAGLADRLSYRLVQPGPLPVDDASFDVVFTKDAIVPMPDKPAFYTEGQRALVAGGVLLPRRPRQRNDEVKIISSRWSDRQAFIRHDD